MEAGAKRCYTFFRKETNISRAFSNENFQEISELALFQQVASSELDGIFRKYLEVVFTLVPEGCGFNGSVPASVFSYLQTVFYFKKYVSECVGRGAL